MDGNTGAHPIRRALERYGVEITADDVLAIAALCVPANRFERRRGGDVHIVTWQGVTMIPIMRDLASGGRGIVTFLPQDAFDAGSKAKVREQWRGKANKLAGHARETKLRDRRARRARFEAAE